MNVFSPFFPLCIFFQCCNTAYFMLLLQVGLRRTITLSVSWPFHYASVVPLRDSYWQKQLCRCTAVLHETQKKIYGKALIMKIDFEVVRLILCCSAHFFVACGDGASHHQTRQHLTQITLDYKHYNLCNEVCKGLGFFTW